MSDTEIEFVESCGNVFADLGLSDLLNQTEAAALLQTSQGRVSAITRGRLTNFSYDRLLRFLNRLGGDVQIVVNSSKDVNAPGTTTASVAA